MSSLSNSTKEQRPRILARLRESPHNTLRARSELDVMHPAAPSSLPRLGAAVSASSTITLARRRRTAYDSPVPDKEGNRLGRLNAKKRTNRAMRFFYVRTPSCALYERRWQGSLRACWFSFLHQSTNPVICRSPRLVAGRGLTAKKEAHMPSSARTPEQSHFEIIDRLTGNANTVAALLSVVGILPPAAQHSALLTCSSIANAVASELAVVI